MIAKTPTLIANNVYTRSSQQVVVVVVVVAAAVVVVVVVDAVAAVGVAVVVVVVVGSTAAPLFLEGLDDGVAAFGCVVVVVFVVVFVVVVVVGDGPKFGIVVIGVNFACNGGGGDAISPRALQDAPRPRLAGSRALQPRIHQCF